ncbi:MAG: hypothetical protein E7319_01520 [Clostridiales bacterium]|nr:hypothetical protein [Clostridiales bacterium]
MKKYVSLLLAVLLAAVAPLAVFAEEADMLKPFEGLVTELVEGGFLMEDLTMGELLINVDDNTVLDGILSIEPIQVGMYVIVDHNGMMTRSIPAQVYALRVGCYTLNGIAGEFTENGVLLTGDPIFGEVFVQMTPTMANVFPGVPMLVYYDGVMTMSLPGKVNARYVLVPEMTGVVSEKDGAGFTLTDEDGNTYRVLTSDTLLVGRLAMNEDEEILPGAAEVEEIVDEGTEVVVDEAADEVSAEENDAVDEVDQEAAAEPVTEDSASPAPLYDVTIPTGEEADGIAAAAIEWGDGDTVTVYHQGPITAQADSELVALGMLVHR